MDNVNVIGLGPGPVNQAMDDIAQRFASLGIAFEVTDRAGKPVVESLGLEFDFSQGMVVRNTRKRAWRLWLATKSLARRQRVSGDLLRVWLGHVNFYFQLNRPCLSVLSSSYRYAATHLGHRGVVWPNVRRELRQVMGLIFLVEQDVLAPKVQTVHVGDSSMHGFSLMKTEATLEEISRELEVREKWRFIPGRSQAADGSSTGSADGPIFQDFVGHSTETSCGLETQFGKGLRKDLDLAAGQPLAQTEAAFWPSQIG